MKKKFTVLMLILAVSFMPLGVFAQQETPQPPAIPGQPQTQPEAGPQTGASDQPAAGPHQHGATGQRQEMMEMCKQMMAKRQEMMAKMKEMDESLQKDVAAMNAATGDQKIQAMADVITTMANQRAQIREMAMEMHESMMGHMGQHMQSTDNRSMSGCPMMQMMMHGKQGTQGGYGAPQGAGSGAAGQ